MARMSPWECRLRAEELRESARQRRLRIALGRRFTERLAKARDMRQGERLAEETNRQLDLEIE